MDFDSLPQDEKIVCLCSIFPEMDPVILNDLLEMYKTAESLFPIILQMTDEDYRPNDVPPRYKPKPPLSLIYPHLQASAPPIDDYESTMRENSNTIAELELDLESWKPMEQKCLPKKTGENKLSDKTTEYWKKVREGIIIRKVKNDKRTKKILLNGVCYASIKEAKEKLKRGYKYIRKYGVMIDG